MKLFQPEQLVGDLASDGHELIIDSFAGAGGASLGIEAALGRPVDIAINHDTYAIEMHKLNHPRTLHYCENIWDVNPLHATRGRPVGLLWASPDCKHFSKAKGGKPVEKRIRGLAWVVLRWMAMVRPRIVILENVEEFQGWGPLRADNSIDTDRKGHTFDSFIRQIRGHGYDVEWRVLNAADYGAPTSRSRLFLVARCDNEPITWPERSHGPDRAKPYHTAAECIDWSIPCHSIFLTDTEARKVGVRRPLADNTMRRIANGLRKYVIEAKEPFIVTINHSGKEFRGQGLNEPFRTITASRDAHGLVVPDLIPAWLLKNNHGSHSADLRDPLHTVTTGGRHALVSAFLTRWFGQSIGQSPNRPAPTATADVNKTGLCTAFLTKYRGTCEHGQAMNGPMPTITAGGYHLAEVRAFLVKYYSNGGQDQPVDRPLDTITARARYGLVTVAGIEYQIIDIGLRMLQPDELKRAQMGRFASRCRLTGPKYRQISAIGNSVCPELAEVLVKANYSAARRKEVAV
ncbi:MAG: DNA cytosine methyltransferase [Phycisphaerae bacterium]|nr:DNA cytosine methyltransferase [Phycisphaerae bacterium]